MQEGCRSAGIGCIECKQPVIQAVQTELAPIQRRAADFEEDRGRVRDILRDGAEAARQVARETLADVMEAMRFTHHL